jgi:hypothetical protein
VRGAERHNVVSVRAEVPVWLVVWTLGCPKTGTVEAPVPREGPLVVAVSADLANATGPGTVVGTLAQSEGGTVLKLADGALVWVSAGAPPPGWDWMMATKVRVQGRLESSEGKVWLREPQVPMPAELAPSL